MHFNSPETVKDYSKKKPIFYKERDEIKRSHYLKKLKDYQLDKLVYIDESGIDKFISREYGWGRKGDKVIGEVSGKRYARESFIASSPEFFYGILSQANMEEEKAADKDNSVWIDKESLKAEMDSWQYPLHFIDFETAMLPIPFNKGSHPYQGIAFQFSHHTLDKNAKVTHAGQYLISEPGVDPTMEFVRHLKKELENDEGTIFRYSNHEIPILT